MVTPDQHNKHEEQTLSEDGKYFEVFVISRRLLLTSVFLRLGKERRSDKNFKVSRGTQIANDEHQKKKKKLYFLCLDQISSEFCFNICPVYLFLLQTLFTLLTRT